MSGGTSHDRGFASSPTERDAVLVALAHPYRRFLLTYLDEELGDPTSTNGEDADDGRQRAATITTIAAAIASEADERQGFPHPHTGIDSVETALYHVHVPRLTEIDVVSCDYDEGTVALTDRWDDVRPILRALEDL